MKNTKLNNTIWKVFVYILMTTIVSIALYCLFDSIHNKTIVEITMKQNQKNSVSVYYQDNEFDINNLHTNITINASDSYDKYSFKVPLEYPYSISLYLRGSEDKINDIDIKNVKVKTLFSSKVLTDFQNIHYTLNENEEITLIDNYVFSQFQVTTKIYLVSILIAIFIIFIFRKKIGKFSTLQENSADIFKIVVFCSGIFGVFLLDSITFDNANSAMSGSLAQKPKLESYKQIFDTSFMTDYETYLKDQIVFREFMIEDYYAFNTLLQKNQFGGRYKIDQGDYDLILNTTKLNENQIEKNVSQIEKISNLFEEKGIPYYFYLAPSKQAFNTEYLRSYVEDDTEEIVTSFNSQMEEIGVPVYDLYNTVNETSKEYGFNTHYNTDHHWTTMSAYYAYLEILQQLADDEIIEYNEPDFSSVIFEDIFTGSDGRGLAYGYRYNQVKDDFNLIYSEGGNYTLTSILNGSSKTGTFLEIMYMDLFNPTEKNNNIYAVYNSVKDKQITNNNLDNDKTAVILGDSYSIPIVYFLTQNFENVVLLDERDEFGSDDTGLVEYLENNEYDVVLNINYYATIQDPNLFEYYK